MIDFASPTWIAVKEECLSRIESLKEALASHEMDDQPFVAARRRGEIMAYRAIINLQKTDESS